ncbi:hypothetical protein [Inquilinus sp.]|jgi:Ca2+-binding RTX toxin-like protein|uniref:hypothetical protein n=1 Tax=Inquilinus sp. TaxID=1932117 RepID=UPI00378405C0
MVRIDGTAGDDILHGTSLADEIYGYDGMDSLYGDEGNDSLIGGVGGDTLSGGDGIDTVNYSTSAAGVAVTLGGAASGGDAAGDIIIADVENLSGSAYADTLIGNAMANELRGNGGHDILDGAGGDDRLFGAGELNGGDGNDRIEGGSDTHDVLRGGSGDDWLYGGTGWWDEMGELNGTEDSYSGGDGIDIVSYAGEGLLNWANEIGYVMDATIGGIVRVEYDYDQTYETLPDDVEGVEGTEYNDRIIGNAGDNILIGGSGEDSLYGGGGIDTVVYESSESAVAVGIGALGFNSGGDAEGDWVDSDIENIVGSDFGDYLAGSDAANALSGRDGGDNLYGYAGADRLDGGDGGDTAVYYESSAGVRVDLALGTGTGGDAEGDVLISIENLTGSIYADTVTGNSVANLLRGDDGDDILRGGAGADTLDGGDGNDLASYADSTKGVTVNLATGVGSGGTATGDALVSIEVVTGSAYADTLTGNAAANALLGGDGNDLLRSGGGADTLDGGAGFDAASYSDSAAAVIVDLGAGTGSGGTAAGDTLVSIEAVNGSVHADRLIGSAAANTLTGAAGRDVLTGAGGADRFVFGAGHSALDANADRITDFSHAEGDRIDLSRIDANGSGTGDAAFTFIGTGAYTGVAGQMRYALSGTDAVIGGDVDGDGVSDFNIALSNVGSLQAADFML